MQITVKEIEPRPEGLPIPFIPAAKSLPDFWKNFPQFFNGKKYKPLPNGGKNLTVKACPPFLDALMAGYFIYLEHDLYVNTEGDAAELYWANGGPNFIDTHDIQQIDKSLLTEEFMQGVWKFINNLIINTPKNYSMLFVHPLNRTDLPFLTLSAVVDTDAYNLEVNFPFLLKKNFNGIIKAGTPIVQMIPIKRENWNHEIKPIDKTLFTAEAYRFSSKLRFAYKSLWRQEKSYK